MTLAAGERVRIPADSLTDPPRAGIAAKLAPLALLILAILTAAAAEIFGPTSVRMAYRSISLTGMGSLSALLAAFPAVIAIHELGHLLAALATRFEVLGIALGPFRLHRNDNNCWGWRFIPRNLFAASVSAVPTNDNGWRDRMLIVVLGGPLATLLSTLGALWLMTHVTAGSWVAAASGSFMALSLIILFLGFVPNGRSVRVRNDAQLFWSILRDTNDAHEIRLYHHLLRLRLQGVRPRDYPEQLTEVWAQHKGRADITFAFADALMKCATDRGELQAAERWCRYMEQLAAYASPALQNVARAEAACFALLYLNDSRSAREKFARVRFSEISPKCLQLRMRAASWAAGGSAPAARHNVQRSLSLLSTTSPESEFQRDLLVRILGLKVPETQGPRSA